MSIFIKSILLKYYLQGLIKIEILNYFCKPGGKFLSNIVFGGEFAEGSDGFFFSSSISTRSLLFLSSLTEGLW